MSEKQFLNTPSPSDEEFEYWVRANALHAAARVTAARVTHNTDYATAAQYTLALTERFEQYLNPGQTRWDG